MHPDAATFGAQIDTLNKKFKRYCAAAALIYYGVGGKYGVRVEAGFIAKEFFEDTRFGCDPEGLLFYDEAVDFEVDNLPITYKCYQNQQSPPCIRIDFYSPENSATDPFCSFISKDTAGVSSQAINAVADGSGTWRDLQTATCYGKLHKATTSTEMTLSLVPLAKKLSFRFIFGSTSTDISVNVTGTFTYLKAADLADPGEYVCDFNADRVVLFRSSDRANMVALYIPSTPIPTLQGETEVWAKFLPL